jgi:hypothetical protein
MFATCQVAGSRSSCPHELGHAGTHRGEQVRAVFNDLGGGFETWIVEPMEVVESGTESWPAKDRPIDGPGVTTPWRRRERSNDRRTACDDGADSAPPAPESTGPVDLLDRLVDAASRPELLDCLAASWHGEVVDDQKATG